MITVDRDQMISISDVSKRGLSKLIADAQRGSEFVVMKNNAPVAAVVGIDQFERLQGLNELQEDLRTLAITLTRMLTSSGKRYSHAEVLARFDVEEADLLPPPESSRNAARE